jgi:hypothetical protein|tara:strand:- start:4304 stop:6124 length:1821 start_codon:yes stop_codon:yes gene_type:complete
MTKIRFNPEKYCPVITKGFPDFNVESIEYAEWWDEQIDRCKNGYKPAGMPKITGKHYFYLNFYKILRSSGDTGGRKILADPWYRHLDKEYFDLFDTCKEEQKGMIIIKARDKGFSYMNSGILAHEYTFYPYNEVGIGAGLEKTATAFFDKVKKGLNALHANIRHSSLKDTNELIRSGFRRKREDGKWEVGGYQSAIYCRTMDNPEVFKGERLGVMVFEEAGEFKHLLNAYMSSKACFMDGDIQFGVPIIGGTGGDIGKASKDFMDMYYNADSFNLIPMFIPASRAYYGFFDVKTGEEDESGAKDKLLLDREKLQDKEDRTAYNLHIQNYPLTVEEAFLKTKGSRFNIALINAQRSRILSSKSLEKQISRGYLEWKFDDSGKTNQVEWIADKNGPYKILNHPKDFKNLYVGGIDSYDQDKAGKSTSLGSAMVYQRFLNLNEPGDYPVAEYTERPPTADEFYDGCLKLAVYYNTKMLVEYTRIGILDYFKRQGALKYLKEKPASAHSPHSVARNRYGLHMTKQVKDLMEQVIDDYLKTNVEDVWFIDLLDELADYGLRNTDRVFAFGLCLLHKLDEYKKKVILEEQKEKKLGFIYYKKQGGRLVPYKK